MRQKSKRIRIAVDSVPLGDLHSAFDYTAEQIWGLTSYPLVEDYSPAHGLRLLGANSYQCRSDGLEHRFSICPDLRFNNGWPVTGKDYENGVYRAISENRAFRMLAMDLKEVTSKDREVTFSLKRPNYAFPCLLQIPAFSPLSSENPSLSAGAYHCISNSADCWIMRKNPYHRHNVGHVIAEIEFSLIRSRYLALDMFLQGELDRTCDTAFPYEKVKEYRESGFLKETWPGIFVAIVFEGRFATDEFILERKVLYENIDRDAIIDKLGNVMRPFRSLTGHDPRLSSASHDAYKMQPKARRIVMAYDDFYPNRMICEIVKSQADALGLTITLREDVYGCPTVNADARLLLFYSPSSRTLLTLSGWLGLDGVRKCGTLTREYAIRMRHAWIGHGKNELLVSMEKLIVDNHVLVPLVEMPGITLCRGDSVDNDFKPGVVWTHGKLPGMKFR